MVKSENEHGENVALMTFGNPTVGVLQQVFNNFNKIFSFILAKKIVDNLFKSFQACNSVELSFSVNQSSSCNFQIFVSINTPSFSSASLLKSPNFLFKYINLNPSVGIDKCGIRCKTYCINLMQAKFRY